ncbi:MAG: hypothetical protein EA397_06610 [Deltaproteobacteria bacterium]|nr:MAG: hypothetical protein EA397_06610 [Deltaproteobacteria bacterium]
MALSSRWISAALVLGSTALTLVGGVAFADPGDGIQLGTSTTFRPRIELGFLSRTNITQSPDNPLAGIALTVAPGGHLVFDTPDTLIDLSGNYRLVKFFTRRLSGLDQFNDFDVSLNSRFLRQSPVGFVVSNRAALVNNNATDRVGNTPFHTRTRNDLSAGVQVRPGSILHIDLRGTYELDDIRVPFGAIDSDTRGLNTRHGFGGRWDVEYRFFPQTAIVVEGNVGRYNWRNNVIERGDSGRFSALPDNTQARVLAGLRGRITDRFVTVAQIGYGVANYDVSSVEDDCPAGGRGCTVAPESSFDAKLSGLERLLLVAQVQYDIAEDRSVTLGYRKDFDDVFFTNYLSYHMVYLMTHIGFGQRFAVDGRATIRQESYRGALNRDDTFLNLHGGGSYELSNWAKLTLHGGYLQRTVPTAPNISFNDVRVQLGAVLTY